MAKIKSNLDSALTKFGDIFTINGTTTEILGKISVNRRTSNPWNAENIRSGIFSVTPEISGGDILYHVQANIYYLVYLMGKETLVDANIAQHVTLLKISKTCAIYRLSGTSGSMGGVKQTFTKQKENIKVHLREITGDLRVERPALLEMASFLLYMQSSEDLKMLDRVVIDSKNYQVEYIDKNTFSNLFEAQLSLDKR